MTNYEKGVLLKDTIYKLYVNEGRSISYIYRILNIDRHTLSKLIKEEWNFVPINQDRKKIIDFLASNKELMLAKIKEGYTQRQLLTEFRVGREFFLKILKYDTDIQNALKYRSYRDKENISYIENERWKSIKGYSSYEISDYGRIRKNNGFIKSTINSLSGYEYVSLINDRGERKNLKVHRLVAYAFCEGRTEEKSEVNHKDGNILNNKASNLEWCTPSENLIHSYEHLNRTHKGGKPIDYIIVYKNKYKFKTIAAFARFIGLSETQAKRWIIEQPTAHQIKKIPK